MAHEYRELGAYPKMIARYEDLVERFPKSPLVLDAYLVLGDYRFDRQDLEGAKQYYRKILDAPESSATPMAHFKMGWVHLNETDYREALREFQQAVETDVKLADAKGGSKDRDKRVDVTREALTDLAYAYTEVYKPRSALRYFRRLAPTRNMYRLALEKLARRYFVKQDFSSAAMVYREIANLSNDAESNLDFTARIYESTKNINSFGRVHSDVQSMLTALNGYRYDWRIAAPQRKAATQDFELYTRDLSTRAQATAIKGKSARQQLRVALAYTRYLDSFPESPHRRDMLENLADTLFEAKLFLRAGDRYEEAAELAKSRRAKEEALYSACASFYEVLKNSAKLPRFDRIWAQQGLIHNGVAYVEAFPKSKRVPQIKINIGRSYYEAGQFDQAVGVFDEFLDAYPRHKGAKVVAELILDTYAQRQDFAGLSVKARELRRRRIGDAAFQRRLASMAKQAEERQIGEVILTASIQDTGGRDAGAQLRQYWERNKSSPVAEKTLYTAFVQFKEARNFEKTFDTGNQFIGAYPKSQYLGDVFGTLASFTTQTGEYEQAAVYLEEYYKRFPDDPTAQRTLAQAAQIKQLIGDHRGAVGAYGTLMRRVRDRDLRTQYGSKLLDSLEKLGDWDGVQAASQALLRIDRRNPKAHLMLGLASEKNGDPGQAARHYQATVRFVDRSANDEALDQAARAAFLSGDGIFRRFMRVSADGNAAAAAEAKASYLAQLEDAMVNVVGYNRGEWAVAALHRVALAYQSFGRFLRSAPLPDGLSPEQVTEYRKVVGQQAAGIDARAAEFFKTCMTKARQLNVFSGAVLGCGRRGPEQRVPPVRGAAPNPPRQRFATLKDALTKDPKNLDALSELADYFLAAGEPAKAKLTAGRGLELDDRNANFFNKLGMADLLLGEPQDAYFSFRKARDLGHPYAAANEAALRVSFGDQRGAARLLDRADIEDLPRGAADLHPGALAVLQRGRELKTMLSYDGAARRVAASLFAGTLAAGCSSSDPSGEIAEFADASVSAEDTGVPAQLRFSPRVVDGLGNATSVVGDNAVLALNPATGQPAVVYGAIPGNSPDREIRYAERNPDGSWSTPTLVVRPGETAGTTGDIVGLGFAFVGDAPHVVYLGGDGDGNDLTPYPTDLMLSRRTGATWSEQVLVDTSNEANSTCPAGTQNYCNFGNVVGTHAAIAGTGNRYFVAYRDTHGNFAKDDFELSDVEIVSSGISADRSVDLSRGGGPYLGVALTPDERPVLAYNIQTDNLVGVWSAVWQASGWVLRQVSEFPTTARVAVAATNDTLYVAYFDSVNNDMVLATSTDGDTWASETVESGGKVGLHPAIAIDPAGQPVLAYTYCGPTSDRDCPGSLNGQSEVRLARRVAGDWDITAVDDGVNNGGVGLFNSLVITGDGTIYVAFQDTQRNDLVVVEVTTQ